MFTEHCVFFAMPFGLKSHQQPLYENLVRYSKCQIVKKIQYFINSIVAVKIMFQPYLTLCTECYHVFCLPFSFSRTIMCKLY